MARFDLTDFEWSVIQPLLPQKSRGVKPVDDWSCHGYVPVSQLIYAAFRSKAKHCPAVVCGANHERGLLPPSDEWRRRGL